MMIKVMHYRYYRGSKESGSYKVWEGNSIKEARGQVKQMYNSQLGVMLKHEQFGDDYQIIEDIAFVRGWDEQGTTYVHFFFITPDE
jgi:hypothetical protein